MCAYAGKHRVAPLLFIFEHNLLYKCLNTVWQPLLINSWKKCHL